MGQLRPAFIGLGESAYHLARGLKKEGLSKLTAYDKFWDRAPQAQLIGERACEEEVGPVKSLAYLIKGADFVVSAVRADFTVPLRRKAQPQTVSGQCYEELMGYMPGHNER